MAITNGYATLADFRGRYLSGLPSTDTTRDTVIEAIIEGTSRQIDNWCARRFYSTTDDETRYYTAACPGAVYTDDILTITSLFTDDDYDGTYGQEWETDDYITFPLNKTPITWIEASGRNNYLRFPTKRKAVRIIGTFGFCTLATVPKPIVEACYLQSYRIYKRQDAPFAVLGANEFGAPTTIPRLDPDVMEMIRPYKFVEVY